MGQFTLRIAQNEKAINERTSAPHISTRQSEKYTG
jgi:hypothetical protein